MSREKEELEEKIRASEEALKIKPAEYNSMQYLSLETADASQVYPHLNAIRYAADLYFAEKALYDSLAKKLEENAQSTSEKLAELQALES